MKDGRTLNPNWLEYRMPTIHHVPKSECIEVMTEHYSLDPSLRTQEEGKGSISAMLDAAVSERVDVRPQDVDIGLPFRTKEAGEGLVSAILAAIGNAIYDAVGVRLYTTPFTPEKILYGLGKIK